MKAPTLFRNRFSVVVLAAALLFLLLFTAFATPLSVSTGLRLWIWWKARQEHLAVQIERIEAPFLRPVVLRGLRMVSARDTVFRVETQAARIDVGLNLKAILLHAGGRAIRNIAIDGLRMEFRRGNSAEPALSEAGWRTLQKLLPGSFDLQRLNLRIETGRTVVLLRNVALSGNEIEAGRFGADQVMLVSPWFRQSFAQLRGATKWEENRLTVAGLSLTPGLDLPSLTSDLSHIDRQSVGLDLDVEVFGGKIRADISHAWRTGAADWNIVGSAGDISLAQTAEALGFADRLGGLLHACNFTFRGDMLDPTRATGWLWTELTEPTWHDRAADTVMFGTTLSNREIQIQQLYIKQGENELTLSGEGSFPDNWSNWPNANFRGDISAAIVNLREFVGLFGANRDHFAGALMIEGMVNAREGQISGQFTASGSALTLFTQPVDLLKANLTLKATELEIEQFELAHADDFLRATGTIDIWHAQDSHGSIDVSVRNLSAYMRAAPPASSLSGHLIFDGRGASIESLQLDDGPLAVGFGGTIDFASLRNVGITLIPANVLFDLGWPSGSDCANAVHFFPAPGPEKFFSRIEKIDLHGDLFSGAWRIALRKDIGPDQEWPLCANGSGQALNIAISDRGTAGLGQSLWRSFRSGEERTLSLSLDQP